MAESLILDLVDHGLKARGAGLALSYDSESFETEGAVRETGKDYYGRTVPKGTHGAVKFDIWTDSRKKIMDALLAIFEQKADPALLIRRINLSLNDVLPAGKAEQMAAGRQISLFDIAESAHSKDKQEVLEKERAKHQKKIESRDFFAELNAKYKDKELPYE